MNFLVLLTFICVSIDTSKSQIYPKSLNDKIRNFDKDFNNRNKDSKGYSYGDYNQPSPIHKFDQVTPDRQHNDEYKVYSPVSHEEYKEYQPVRHEENAKTNDDDYERGNQEPITRGSIKSLKSLKDLKDYEPGRQEEDVKYSFNNDKHEGEDEEKVLKDNKEGAIKKFAKLDKYSDKGHNKKDFVAEGGYHDQQKDGKAVLEKSGYEKDDEYSHDKGFGFIKAWGWDRKHTKKDISGQKTKKLAQFSVGDKGGHEFIANHDSSGHDQKSIKAIGGGSGYKKTSREEGARKISSNSKSDYDNLYPIYG